MIGAHAVTRGVAAGALVLAALVAPAGQADAAPSAACPAGDGVTVVVDFGALGGGVQVRCVMEPVSSGFDALWKAGFTYTGAQRFPGLICRIDGKPADDPCVNAPASDRYWAYWAASRPGGTWSYNELGAGNRTPPPGSVEGWAFSDGCERTPGSGSCEPLATTTTRRPSTTTTVRVPVGGVAVPTTRDPGGAAVAGPTTTTTSRAPDANAPTPGPARPGTRAPEAGEAGDAELAAATTDGRSAGAGDGSPTGVIAGLVAVLGLGAAGLWRVRSSGRERV